MLPEKYFRDRRGVTAVEFAVIAPCLIALILGTFEIGRYMFTYNSMDAALAKAARIWMIDPTVPESDVKTAYCERAFLTDCAATEFSVITQSVDGQTWRTINASTAFESPVSGFLPIPRSVARTEKVPIYVY